ncbi:MAG: triphosphoribosyl-dephospho-CoA synthase [Peptococcaceae bacterium]|nr:triphosphoribosyl-dephospho-CoA synthase [Peptococcaceae bacterium]
MNTEIKNKGFNWKMALMAQTACILEADAPKVGNVNRFHDFADASLEDFHCSALAIGRPFGYLERLGVGKTVYDAVKATRKVVLTNTNLGIILLLAPLGMAWCRIRSRKDPDSGNHGSQKSLPLALKREIGEVLQSLGAEDTRHVYQAIRLASPAGMGEVQQYDVLQEESPPIPLLKVMKLAAGRDLIARQYRDDFELVLGIGYEALNHSLEKGLALPQAIAHSHLILLSQVQDSLITRKLGPEWGREVQKRARFVWEQGGWLTAKGLQEVREFDSWLRGEGHSLNPGTTADLMAAIILVYLMENDQKKRRC